MRMNKAQIYASRTDVMFQCPTCDTTFVYEDEILPTEVPTYHTCEKCNLPLFIEALSVHVGFKKLKSDKKKPKTGEDYYKIAQDHIKLEKAAKTIIMSYGFTKSQVDAAREYCWQMHLINTGDSLEEVVKNIIANID